MTSREKAAAYEGFTLGGRNDGQQRSTIWNLKTESYGLQWTVTALSSGIPVHPVARHHGEGIPQRKWTPKCNGCGTDNRNPRIERIVHSKSMESGV